MAGIDKLYLNKYQDLEDLRRWALVYYPKLLLYFYTFALEFTEKSFTQYINREVTRISNIYKKEWDKNSSDGTINSVIAELMRKQDMSEDEAIHRAIEMKNNSEMSIAELKENILVPIMNTPLNVDRKLKWVCPLPAIRQYLIEQCGTKERWYYKLFWKGKKYFQ